MEHIVQIAIGVDDNAIKRRIEEAAYDDILNRLFADAKKALNKHSYYSRNGYEIDWERIANKAISDFIRENREEVIEAAAKKLKDSFVRTKLYKETMADVLK